MATSILTRTPSRKSYAILKKIQVIKAYEQQFSYSLKNAASYFAIDKSMVHRWVQNKEEIFATERSVRKIMTSREIGEYPELEKKLIESI